MNKFLKASGLTVALMFVLTGCGTGPIYNVQNAEVNVKSNTASNDIYKAIKQAGAQLGWIINKTGEGKAKGTIHLRSHQAVVIITYNSKTYDIIYKSSINLNSDGTKIHTNYNGWIQNLEKAINVQLSLLSE